MPALRADVQDFVQDAICAKARNRGFWELAHSVMYPSSHGRFMMHTILSPLLGDFSPLVGKRRTRSLYNPRLVLFVPPSLLTYLSTFQLLLKR